MYRRFLSNTLVPQFHRLSRSLPDIQCQAAALWPKYLSGAAAQQRRQQQRDDGQVSMLHAAQRLRQPCRKSPGGSMAEQLVQPSGANEMQPATARDCNAFPPIRQGNIGISTYQLVLCSLVHCWQTDLTTNYLHLPYGFPPFSLSVAVCSLCCLQGDEDVDQESLMYSAVTDKLQSALRAFQPATCCTLAAAAGVGGAAGKQHRQGAAGAHMAAGLELCRLSKLLLVAGEFLAVPAGNESPAGFC